MKNATVLVFWWHSHMLVGFREISHTRSNTTRIRIFVSYKCESLALAISGRLLFYFRFEPILTELVISVWVSHRMDRNPRIDRVQRILYIYFCFSLDRPTYRIEHFISLSMAVYSVSGVIARVCDPHVIQIPKNKTNIRMVCSVQKQTQK